MMRYKYFLFDWDGSLADTLPIWFAGFTKIFANYGITVTDEIIGREVIGDWQGPERLGVVNSDKFFDEVEEEVLEKLNKVKLNEGVMELLTEIKKRGGRIAVITSSKKRWVKGALRANGLREMVDVFIGKEDVSYTKPDPEGLLMALKFMKGKPEEAIMIGDNEKDVIAGKRIGADTGLYFPERYEQYYQKEKQLSLEATYVFESFEELMKMI